MWDLSNTQRPSQTKGASCIPFFRCEDVRKKDDLTPRGWLSLLSVCVAVSARTALERAPSAAGMVLATLAIVLPPLLAMVVFPTPQVQWHRLAGGGWNLTC